MPTFEDIAESLDLIMGVKAVWGRSTEPVMCFGSRGDAQAKDRAHFTQARATAEKAISQPFLVTIGGGEYVEPELDERTLELVRVTGVFGETKAFVHDPEILRHLEQWPVAVVLSEVYEIDGEPHLIRDLGFADRRILANAYDGVRRDDAQMQALWEALRSKPVRDIDSGEPGKGAPESPGSVHHASAPNRAVGRKGLDGRPGLQERDDGRDRARGGLRRARRSRSPDRRHFGE